MSAWDPQLEALRAQLAEALDAEGTPSLARDLSPPTQALVQQLSALVAIVRYTRTPPVTVDQHAECYLAQIVATELMPRSRMSAADMKNRELCREVQEMRRDDSDVTREYAWEEVARRHEREKGCGFESIKKAYYAFRWEFLAMFENPRDV